MKKILSSFLLLASSVAVCAAASLSDAEYARQLHQAELRQQQEDASLALIKAMQFEDPQWRGSSSGYDRRDRKSKDDDETASLALIAAMQLADQGSGSDGFAHSLTVYKIQTHAKVAGHRKTLAPIVEMLKKVQQGADVHDLDAHVAANMATLHAIGEDFAADNSKLTAAEIKGYLEGFLKQNPDFYKGYEATAVTHPQLLGYIDAALATASADASTIQMYSRVTSLIQLMEKEGMDTRTYMQHFFDAVSENYLTQGGCFQGVRNRIYVRYVSMLYSLMG
jgi:hypothetical protein